jgi:hypothetical protein
MKTKPIMYKDMLKKLTYLLKIREIGKDDVKYLKK